MSVRQHIRPCWVVVHGELHHVSSFAVIPPSERPQACCPICDEPVILKLGSIRSHHYAHRPETLCSASQPETALHLNTKFYIYQQLRGASSLCIEQVCTGHCGRKKMLLWQEHWDAVEVEFTMDSIRPDIALLKQGMVVAAIEIVVTHALDDHKKQRLSTLDVPWVEIKASELLYMGDTPWIPEQALSVWRISSPIQDWRCDSCTEQRKRAQEQSDDQRLNYESIHAAKMVDLYFPSGKKYREVYFVVTRYRKGTCVEVFLRTERGAVIAVEKGNLSQEVLQRLKAVVIEQLHTWQDAGTIIDERIKWQKWEYGHRFVAKDTDRYPFRYVWNARVRQWERV